MSYFRSYQVWTPAVLNLMKAMRLEGWSWDQMSDYFGKDMSAVRRKYSHKWEKGKKT